MDRFLQRLAEPRPILLDGATGTELTRRGVNTDLPLWSARALIEAPPVVRQIHRDYVDAGAELIVANTFRSNWRTLSRAGLESRGAELNRLAVELAREAAAGAPREMFVAASVAPVEDCYHPELVPDDAALREEHARMAEWLAAATPDVIWIETMNTLREAGAALSAARSTGLPCAISFVLDESGRLLSGESLREAVALAETGGACAVGVNCMPPRGVSAALPTLRAQTALPLAAYAHIGNPEPIRGWHFSESVSPADYAGMARGWVNAGARIVGGCCGTTPAHITAVARSLAST